MKKQVYGRKFKRDRNERKALFSSLISAMILRGKIETTEEKAKAIRSDLEKMVTKAKKGEISRRILSSRLKPWEVDKMLYQIAPTFKEINGGYTRILKTGRRFSDNAGMAFMQWSAELIKMEKPLITETPIRQAQGKQKKVARKTSKGTSSSSAKAKTSSRAVRKTQKKDKTK